MANKPYAHTYTRAGKIHKPHHKLTASGIFKDNSGNTVESWTTSISMGAPAGDTLGAGNDGDLLNAAVAFWSSLIGSSHVDTGTKMTQVKVATIDTTLVNDEPKSAYARDPRIANTSVIGTGPLTFPTEVAQAVTLDTMDNKKHSGRFYLPGPATGLDSTRRVSSVLTQQTADLVAASIDTLNATIGSLGGGTGLSLATIVAGGFFTGLSVSDPPGPVAVIVPSLTVLGTNRYVGRVRVGDVLDVITRRRDKMRENYASAS